MSSAQEELEQMRERTMRRKRAQSVKMQSVKEHESAVQEQMESGLLRVRREKEVAIQAQRRAEEQMRRQREEVAELKKAHDAAELKKAEQREQDARRELERMAAVAAEQELLREQEAVALSAKKEKLLSERMAHARAMKQKLIQEEEERMAEVAADRQRAMACHADAMARKRKEDDRRAVELEREHAAEAKRLEEAMAQARLAAEEKLRQKKGIPTANEPASGVAERIASLGLNKSPPGGASRRRFKSYD